MATLTGGDKLTARLAELAKSVTKSATLSVGFMPGASYPDGTSIPMVAAIQEFGAPARNIPPRPFFRDMIAAESGAWPDAVAGLLVKNDYDATATLEKTGEGILGQLKQSIADFSRVPLAPATIKRKQSEKQLIDSGIMYDSGTFKVE